MTTEEFNERFPKPWRWVEHGVTMSLRAANDAALGSLKLRQTYGIPQVEFNRHLIAGLSETVIPFTDEWPRPRKTAFE